MILFIELKIELLRQNKTLKELAKELKMTESTLSNKINKKQDFKLSELLQTKNFLKLSDDRFIKIFFED